MTGDTDDQAASRRFILDLMRQQKAERQKQQDWQRRGKECPIQRPMLDKW